MNKSANGKFYSQEEVATMFYLYSGKNVPCNGEKQDEWCKINCNDNHPAYGKEELTIDQKGIACWKHALQEGWLNG